MGKVGDDEHKCCKSFAEHLPKQQEDEGGCSTRRGENGKELQVGYRSISAMAKGRSFIVCPSE